MDSGKQINIDIRDIMRIFIRRLWIILLAAAIVAASLYVLMAADYTEQYTSESTIMVMNPEDNLSASSSASYYSLTISAVKDCELLLTSRTVLYQVIQSLGLEAEQISYSRLKSMISISHYADSHVLSVSVTSGDSELSKTIVDELCRIGAKQIEDYIEFATAKVIDEGTQSRYPSNSVNVSNAVIAGMLTAILVFAIFFIIEINDDKIKSGDDVEQILGLSVLGVIPYSSSAKEKHQRSAARRRKR